MMLQALTSLPFLSIATAKTNLFSPAAGIYANPLETDIAWERAVSVEYVQTNNASDFAIDCGLRIDGTTAERSFADTRKKSFALFFRGEYGAGRLNYDLFGETTAVRSFDDLVLRAGFYDAWADDSLHAKAQLLRNAFAAETQRDMGGIAPHHAFMHLYLDGLYWGMYDVSERLSGDFAADYFGGRASAWDVFNRDWEEGDGAAYSALLGMVHAGPVSNAVYQRIQGNDPDGSRNPAYPVYFDAVSYIDYVLLQMWSGNHRWIESNIAMMRNRDDTESTGFKWCAWDSEAAMADDGIGGLNLDMTARGDPTGLRAALLANAEFRLQFADRIQKHMLDGGALTASAAVPRYRELADRLEPAIVAESARWGDQDGSAAHTLAQWRAERDWLLDTYLPQRGGIVLQQFRDAGVFPVVDAPTFSQHGGMFTNGFRLAMVSPHPIYYTLDGTDPRQYGTGAAAGSVYSNSIPLSYAVTVKARARGGISNEWSALTEAVFTPDAPSPLRVTELMYHPRNPTGTETNAAGTDEAFQFVELLNTGTGTAGLAGIRFTDGIAFDFAGADVNTLGVGEYVVIVSDLDAFTNRYPGWAGMTIAGEFQSMHDFPATRLAANGERVRLEDALGRPIASFTYGDGRTWPLAADGAGHSLVPLVVTNQASDALDYGGHWRASATIDGSPGRADPEPIRNVVLNEIMAHTDYTGGALWQDSNDWIEMYNATAQAVGLTNWYLSDRPDDLKRWPIPASNVVTALGWKTFYEVGGFHPATNSGFGLSKDGDSVYLSYLPGTTNDRVADCVRFYGQENNISLGRYTDGSNAWFACRLTPDASNELPSAPMVVINEIMYHPRPTLTNPENNTNDEFVELYNPSGLPATLMNVGHDEGVWRMAGGIGFTFPSNTVIPAGGYLALVSFDPATNATARSAFLSTYGLTNGQISIMGAYSGQLGNEGDSVRLERPVDPDIPGDPVSWFVVDEVTYFDQAPWPSGTDGTGRSLLRRSGAGYGNDAANWTAPLAPTPGWASSTFQRIVAAAAGHGMVIPSGDVWVPRTASATFDIVPDNWYHATALTIDGTNVGTPAQYVFTNVVTDHALDASFAPDLATNQTPVWWLVQSHSAWTNDFDTHAVGDHDQDGMPTWQEWIAGTDPTNPASAFGLTITMAGGTGVYVSVETIAAGPEYDGRSRYYTLESASNLTPGVWISPPGWSNLLGVGQMLIWTNETDSSAPAFFRAGTRIE